MNVSEATKKTVSYIGHINREFTKRKVSIDEVARRADGIKFIVRIDRDDFGHWSADNGYCFKTEEELYSFLTGMIAFYDSISHTPKNSYTTEVRQG